MQRLARSRRIRQRILRKLKPRSLNLQMKIFLASDHEGFELKKKLIVYLQELGYATEDCGPYSFNVEDDYPDFVTPCAQEVASQENSFGIIIGKTGEGEAMCANRVRGIRAGVLYTPNSIKSSTGQNEEIIQLMREHNNANMLSLGAAFLSEEEARIAVKEFIETPFSNVARHTRRLAKF